MWKLKDFDCPTCGVHEQLVEPNVMQIVCCGKTATAVIGLSTGNPLMGEIRQSFNAHYDDRLGRWFESADHKKRVLTEMGRTQLSGPSSPRKSRGTSTLCTKDQAARAFGPEV